MPGRAPTVVAVSMVRNEQDIIEPFVRHNLQFVDAMVVLDHGSVDDTPALLERLAAETDRLSVGRVGGFGFTQAAVTNGLIHAVQRVFRADFVIALDADEFLRVADGTALRAAFGRIPLGDAGLIAWQTFLPARWPALGSHDAPRGMRRRRRTESPGHSKVVLRLDGGEAADWTVDRGNHWARHAARDTVAHHALTDLRLIHVPIRSVEQATAKTALGWLSRLAADPAVRQGEYSKQYRLIFDRIAAGAPIGPRDLRTLSLTYAQDIPTGAIRDRVEWRYRRSLSDGRPLPAVTLLARAWEQALLAPSAPCQDIASIAFAPPLARVARSVRPEAPPLDSAGAWRPQTPVRLKPKRMGSGDLSPAESRGRASGLS